MQVENALGGHSPVSGLTIAIALMNGWMSGFAMHLYPTQSIALMQASEELVEWGGVRRSRWELSYVELSFTRVPTCRCGGYCAETGT